MGLYIRLNNQFVYKKGKKFYLTNIKKVSEWRDMNTKQKERVMGKDVTTKIKSLLNKKYSRSCSYKEGMRLMSIIDKIKGVRKKS